MKTNPEADRFLVKDHPLTAEINGVRKIILEPDDRIQEAIKWIRIQDGS
jgi:hypothetical protein